MSMASRVLPLDKKWFKLICYLVVIILVVGAITIITSEIHKHHKKPVVKQTSSQTTTNDPVSKTDPQNSKKIASYHYAIGEKAYCWDITNRPGGNNSEGWYPCKVLGIEDNFNQYFVQVYEGKDTYMWHTLPVDMSHTGTYTGQYQ